MQEHLVGELFEWVTARFHAVMAESGRALVIGPTAGVTVMGDAEQLRNVMLALVDNALRHGAGPVSLGAAAANDGVELSVRDEGNGFPPGFLERPAGRGLATVDAIVSAHGGRIWVAADGSATVHVWFPASRDLS